MNAAHLHLITVHIPIVLVPFGAALFGFGLWKKEGAVLRVGLFLFVVAALFAFIAELSGEEAEEIVEHLAGVSERAIENHEEWGESAMVLTAVLGGLSVIHYAVLRWLEPLSRLLAPLILILAVVTSGVLAFTGQEGGRIRHPEAFTHEALKSDHPGDRINAPTKDESGAEERDADD